MNCWRTWSLLCSKRTDGRMEPIALHSSVKRLNRRRRGIERSIASVCLPVCALEGSYRHQIGRPIAHGRTSACTDPKVKRSNVKVKLFFTVCIGFMDYRWCRHRCKVLLQELTGAGRVGLVGLRWDVTTVGVGSACRFDCQLLLVNLLIWYNIDSLTMLLRYLECFWFILMPLLCKCVLHFTIQRWLNE